MTRWLSAAKASLCTATMALALRQRFIEDMVNDPITETRRMCIKATRILVEYQRKMANQTTIQCIVVQLPAITHCVPSNAIPIGL